RQPLAERRQPGGTIDPPGGERKDRPSETEDSPDDRARRCPAGEEGEHPRGPRSPGDDERRDPDAELGTEPSAVHPTAVVAYPVLVHLPLQPRRLDAGEVEQSGGTDGEDRRRPSPITPGEQRSEPPQDGAGGGTCADRPDHVGGGGDRP